MCPASAAPPPSTRSASTPTSSPPAATVGAAAADADTEPFEEKLARLTGELEEQFAEGARLEEHIRTALGQLGGR
jgi:hypothetical protein